MKSPFRFASALLLSLTLLLVVAPTTFAQDITARFYPEKQEYLVGEPVIIVLEVVNNSSNDIEVDDGHCYWIDPEQFQIADAPSRKEVSLSGCPSGGSGGSCVAATRKTAAGARFEQRFLLAGAFDLSQPGTYHVKALRHVNIYGGGRSDDVITTVDAQSSFEILLRQPKQGELEAAYQPFLTDINGTDEERKTLAMSALTQNPPQFLEKAILSLAADGSAPFGSVDGLEHLATPAARARLIELASGDDQFLRQQAVYALGEIGDPGDCDAILNIAAHNRRYDETDAYLAVGRVCRERGVPFLAGLLPSAHQRLATAVATGLGNTASRKSVPILIGLLVSPDFYVRQEAADALLTLTHRETTEDVVADPSEARQAHSEWRSWWDLNSQTAPIYGPDECPK
jgi:hypothetical protein